MKRTSIATFFPVSLVLLFCAFSTMAQPVISWNKYFAGAKQDWFQGMTKTEDGGYLLVGYSSSPASGDKSEDNESVGEDEYQPDEDIWIIKVDANGEKQWDKTYGFGDGESARSVIATPDGGYLVGGESRVDYGPCPCFQDVEDYLVLKIDKDGNEQWQKNYTSGWDFLAKIVATQDGGYLLAGTTFRNYSGDEASNWDYWIVKIDENGNELWDKVFRGRGDDNLTDALATEDGGFLLAGYSESDASFDKSEDNRDGCDRFGYCATDYWVVKVDENGNKLWDKTFGGNESDYLQAIAPTTEGGYLLIGNSESGASADKSAEAMGGWVIKIDEQGNKLWDKIIGDENNQLLSALPSTDGHYLLAGYIPYNDGRKKAWAVKIDGEGDVLWDQPIGNRKSNGITDIITTADGGYLMGGIKYEYRYENGRNESYAGYWIVKLDDKTTPVPLTSLSLMNADTDEVLYELQDGAEINLSDLGHPHLTVRANTTPVKVEKVTFELTGPISHTQTENNWPYALFGDDPDGPRDYIGRDWQAGEYTLTVTPYQAGKAGRAVSISFSVIDDISSAVAFFVLVNADTDQDIRRLRDGDVIDLSALGNPSLSIRANTTPVKIDRIELSLAGPLSHMQTESGWPYALFGDNPKAGSGRDYIGRDWQTGNYTLTATPYENNQQGATATISFSVTGNSSHAPLALEVYPVPTTGVVNITHEGTAEQAKMMLLDQSGNIVLEQPLSRQDQQLDLSSFRKGFYYLKIASKEAVEVKRILLE